MSNTVEENLRKSIFENEIYQFQRVFQPAPQDIPIIDLAENQASGKIDHEPEYQRKFVWSLNKQSYFIESVIYAAWERGGKTASQLEDTNDEKKKIVKGNNVIIDNLQLNANELGTIYLSFNFLTKKATEKNKYRYHVIQRDASTGEIMGGETFEIKKKPRNLFNANAGSDREIFKNEEVILTAEDIFEAAEYNWYDENGNLIYTGQNLTVSPEITKKYKLEVITEDGFKDYGEVEVKVNPYKLIGLSPNPANSQIQVNYDIENSTSAYIMITGVTNGVSNNYVLNTNSTQTTISLNNYQSGHYVVTLVCDGQIIESKNLIKN